MDSKFAPDGSLYVQVYDGFFTTGPNAGLWRFTYTGGPDTPGADPEWQATGNPREVQFDIGASGGVAYEWDFGDGETSTEENPVHTFATDGPHEVTLTVTYADDETDSATITVNVQGGDTVPPVTTIELDGADPVPTYDGPVEVTLAATDAGGSGVELSQYRVDAGAFTDYTAPFTVSGDGEHTVEYRSRDVAGNVEETKSVTFTIETGGGGGGDCLSQSDEFDGSALDPRWDVLRQAGAGPQVAGGSLGLEIRQGDFIANDPLAENTLLQDAPSGEWTVTTRLDTSQIDANGEQAGLVIWKSENPNTFSKIVAIQANSGNHQFEHIVTQDGGVDPPIPQSITPAPGGQLPDQVLLRARYDGTNVIGEFSADNGQSWTLIGQEGHAAPLEAPLRVGLVAFRGGNGGGTASFDWFRVQEGSDPGGPVCEPGGACPPALSDEFEGNQIDIRRWSFRHPTTPQSGAGAPRVEGGNLVFPLGANSVDQDRQGPIAFLGQPLPEGDFTMEAKINAPGLNTDTGGLESDYAQLGLGLYQTDDDWIEILHTRNADDGGTANTYFEMKYETEGSRTLGPRVGDAPASENLPTFWLRVARTGNTITGAYSLTDPDQGGEWTDLQASPDINEVFSPADGPVYIGPVGANGTIEATYEYVRFTPDETECPGGDSCDEFEGTELDPKWEIVNPSPTNPPTVGDGHLNMPIIQGDLFGDNGTAQMVLQGVPADQSWVLTAKIAHANIDTNGEAAGLALVNTLSPPSTDNHFAKTALQFKNDTDPDEPGDQPGVWAERVLTADSQAVTLPPETVPYPNSGALDFEGDYGWVRFVHDAVAQEIGTWTSTDGETFVNFGQNMPVDEYLSEPGGLRAGLFAKHDGSGDDVVQIDAFNVVLGSADPQTPPDECNAGGGGDNTPPTTTATLDPPEPDGENGWFTTPVEVTLAATDNEGGSGVESTLYAIDGGDFTDYEEPFTVSGDGEHEVEFRSTDAEGNLEATKSLAIKIDGTPPETEATVDGREVTLEADDGPNGSGVAETRFRIDDGPWQTYVDEETILGSESDLGRWAQAGPGGLNWLEVTDTVAAVTASAENPPDEVAGNLVDGDAETKWLAFESTGWVEFELSEPSAVVRYSLTSANDAPGRDPSDWTLQGSDDGETWTELDQQSGQDFADRFQTNVYEFENETAYGYYRLDFTANGGDDLLQLADVELSDGTSGFARTQGGLGMPWYPVKDYGDFSLKMEWRDSSEGANGNSGVFVRFPDPRIPLAERPTSGPGDWDGDLLRAHRRRRHPAGLGRDLLRPGDPDQRPPGRLPEDRLDLQLRPGPASRPRNPAEGHLGRLRDQGRGPAVHGDPQRHGADRVRQLDPARVLPRR